MSLESEPGTRLDVRTQRLHSMPWHPAAETIQLFPFRFLTSGALHFTYLNKYFILSPWRLGPAAKSIYDGEPVVFNHAEHVKTCYATSVALTVSPPSTYLKSFTIHTYIRGIEEFAAQHFCNPVVPRIRTGTRNCKA